MFVLPDGRVLTNSIWDESGREAGVYKNGDAVANAGYTHGWGEQGGVSVTANGTYLYLALRRDCEGGNLVDANSWPAKGTLWFGISRRPLSNVSSAAPFSGGKGGAEGTLSGNYLIVNSVADGTDASIAGMAADANRLYVSNPYNNEIRVYDANSMAQVSKFSVSKPGKLAIDRNGTLWIVQTSPVPQILHYTASGSLLNERITDVVDPRGLSIDNQGRLMVAEAGPRQQILIYDVSSSPKLVSSFGASGGVQSGATGQLADQKLISPIAAGMDSAGNIYVAGTMAGSDLRAFSPSGTQLWAVRGLAFIDVAVADPATDGADVYTKFSHFSMDYSKSAGQEWSWKGMTVDPYRYPSDIRISSGNPDTPTAVAVRTINGRKFLYLSDQYSSWLAIYRMEGETAVPSGIIAPHHINNWQPGVQPAGGKWIWRDTNGDGNAQSNEFIEADGTDVYGVWGWDIDDAGNVWTATENSDGVRKYSMQGLDASNNPIYTRAGSTSYGVPSPFTQLERLKYVASTDTLYISGYTTSNPIGSGYWGQAGTEIVRYDNWSAGNRNPAWRITLPYDPANNRTVKMFSVAGNRVFAGLLASCPGENVYVYDTATGASAGLLKPGPEVGSNMGWIDGSLNLQAYQRSNGEYLIFSEEVAWEKVLMYRMAGTPSGNNPPASNPPTVSFSAPANNATVSGTVTVSASASSSSGMAGVQFKLDGANLGVEDTTSPYSVSWNAATAANGTHTLTAIARNTAGQTTTASIQVTVSGGTTAPFTPIRINAGGGVYTDGLGQTWSEDTGFAGGSTYSTGTSILGTSSPALYQSERWNASAFQYQFAVPNGSYKVTLKFAELYYTQAGKRVFNVTVNNQTMLSNFDVFSQAGAAYTAVDQSVTTSVTNGQLVIQFTPVVAEAKINGIEIVQQTQPVSVAINPQSASVAAGQTQQFLATVSGSTNTAVTWSVSPQVGSISSTGLYTAPGTISAAQTVTVTAKCAADSSKTATASISLTPNSTPAAFNPIRINAGGGAMADPNGNAWSADTGSNGGDTYANPVAVANTSTPALYQSERWSASPFQYQFAVPNGAYTVMLKFSENFYAQANQRVFSVTVNGQSALNNFDIFAKAGGAQRAVDKAVQVSVTNGQITIQFTPIVGEAKVNAIEIVAGAGIRINAGGGAMTDMTGRTWSADTGYTAGSAYSVSNAIAGTVTPALYQSSRWNAGTLQYQFNVANGSHNVILKFAEPYYTQAGKRVFDIVINGQTVQSKFDAFAAAGGRYVATDRCFPVTVTGGQIVIKLVGSAGEPSINAIEIQ